MIKAVFFDFFQTLVRYDPPREQIIADVLREYGHDLPPERFVRPLVTADEFMYRAMSEKPLGQLSPEQRLALYVRHQEILFEQAGVEVDADLIPVMLGKMQEAGSGLATFEDVLPALDRLREGGNLTGLISNVDTDIAGVLEKLGLAERLDVVMTSREAGVTKPHRGIFEAALQAAGVGPGEALYVGDQYEIDVLGAAGAGMSALLIDRTGFSKADGETPRIATLDGVFDYL
jgi:HAD superfamily hydrolase (TIGR01549 family)